ncbi:hypothetical protein RI367_007154 [Sorochytrium milnesiophthora]
MSPDKMVYGAVPRMRCHVVPPIDDDLDNALDLSDVRRRQLVDVVYKPNASRKLLQERRTTVVHDPLKVGDAVLLTMPPVSGKLKPKWTGPHQVHHLLRHGALLIGDSDGNIEIDPVHQDGLLRRDLLRGFYLPNESYFQYRTNRLVDRRSIPLARTIPQLAVEQGL